MTRKQNLIPTSITNKNGVRTTVYKKPVTETPSSARLPIASLPSARQTRQALEHEIAHALVNQDLGPPMTEIDKFNRSKDSQLLLTVLPKYGDETLRRVMEAASTDISWELDSLLRSSQPSEEYVNDWIVIRSAQIDNTVNHEHIITGLEAYEHLAPQDNGHYPEQRATAVTAILLVSAHLGTMGEGLVFDVTKQQEIMIFIEDDRLRDLLATHANPDAIANIIVNRNLTDADQIIEVHETMNTTPNAVSTGVL